MGVIKPGDEELHYSDGAHRWLSPRAEPNEALDEMWRQRVRDHLGAHRDGPLPHRVARRRL